MTIGLNNLSIELLDAKRHERESFDCGVLALNTYLQRQAAQDMGKHAAVVYVALIDAPKIAGYYTLSQFSIDLERLPEELSKRLPRYPIVPATLLGRMAVASSFHGQRIGETLLFDALRRSLKLSAQVASTAVIVDAKDENAEAFYRRYGFIPILDEHHRLFLPMRTILRMF